MANFTDLTFTQTGESIYTYDEADIEYDQIYNGQDYFNYDGIVQNDFIDQTGVSSNFTDLIGD